MTAESRDRDAQIRPARAARWWLEAFDAAYAARTPILADRSTDCLRLLHGAADDLPGVVIEQFGSALILQELEEHCRLRDSELRALAEHAAMRTDAAAVYRKRFPRDRAASAAALEAAHKEPTPWIGAACPPVLTAREFGMRLLVRPYDGYATGLFLEQRLNRKRVRERAPGMRVLNLFAYTCAFGVAAGLGGAADVVNVDVSRRYLEWGRENLAANDIPEGSQAFLRFDVLDTLRRFGKQGREFDLVIVDPPSFGRVKGRRKPFVLKDQMDTLLAASCAVLAPGGGLFFSCNNRAITRERIERGARAALGDRRITSVTRPRLPIDFRGDDRFATSIWVDCRPE